MHRLIPATFALCIALFSSSGFALQLGSVEKASALGEPLQVRMEILSNRYDASQDLTATIRPDLEYRSDAAMNAEIASLQAEIVTINNTRYVSVTSASPVHSPVLAFRVRVGDKAEGFTRGYRLLLDPPISQLQRARPQVTQAPTSGSVSEPVSSGETYGPVKPGDTLWKIASRLTRSTGIATGMLVQQLHALNPQAFVNGDINRLRVDVILQIPGSARRGNASLAAAEPAALTAKPVTSGATEQAKAAELARAKATLERARAYIIARQAELEKLEAKVQSARESSPAASPERAPVSKTITKTIAQVEIPATPAVTTTQAMQSTPVVAAPMSVPVNEPASFLPPWWRTFAALVLLALFAFSISKAWAQLMQRRRLEAAHAVAERQRVEAVAVKADRAEAFRRGDKEAIENTPEEARPQLDEPGHLVVELNDDTLTEADINIAYGRYQEAEAALQDVLEQAPSNYLARFKLAELYYTMRRSADFVEVAAELAGQRAMLTDADWQRLISMGQEIAPDEPLFGGLKVVSREADGAA